ncbi:MAG: hypothetical protein JWO77_2831 [Ilumatobacteraceae bacterium]|nr:hypothetical protein [Ilumatobacteraceae bacterium]
MLPALPSAGHPADQTKGNTMDTLEAAAASGDAINGLGTKFMLDLDTYVYGATLGFEGADFYLSGRGGALGDVPAGVVAAAFVFWNPAFVAAGWDRTAGVMPRREAAQEFAGVCHRWAEEHMGNEVDTARLAELAGRLNAAASPACAPLFAGWRSLDEPDADRSKALALHRVNGLRELRGALHGAAILATGVTPHAAVARRTPYMLEVFGWQEPHPDKADVRAPWAEAQAATERSVAPMFETLDPAERAEFVDLVNALQVSVNT